MSNKSFDILEPEGCTSEEMGQYVGEIVEVMKACRPRLFLKPEQCTIPNREVRVRTIELLYILYYVHQTRAH